MTVLHWTWHFKPNFCAEHSISCDNQCDVWDTDCCLFTKRFPLLRRFFAGLHSPASITVGCGYVTEFLSMECGQKWNVPLSGKAHEILVWDPPCFLPVGPLDVNKYGDPGCDMPKTAELTDDIPTDDPGAENPCLGGEPACWARHPLWTFHRVWALWILGFICFSRYHSLKPVGRYVWPLKKMFCSKPWKLRCAWGKYVSFLKVAQMSLILQNTEN